MKVPEGYALVGGEDEFMVDRQAEEWFKEQKASFGENAEIEVIDGRASNVSDVENCISRFMQGGQNLSLFGDQKVIWLRQVNFLADNQTGRAEGTKSALKDLTTWLETFNDANTFLLISASPVDRRKAFPKFFDKQKKLQFISPGKGGDQLVYLVKLECQKHGISIEEEAIIALIARVSGNTRMMMNELEKLATYLDNSEDKRVTYSLVNDMVSQFGETEFFELADAFYNFNLQKALRSVRRHFFTHKDARPVLTNLQNRNRLLIQLRSLKDGGWFQLDGRQLNAASIARAQQAYADYFHAPTQKSEYHPFGQNPWYLSRLAGIANTIPLRTLIDFQLMFIETFSRILDHPNEQEQLVRNLVIDCHKKLAPGNR